MSEGKTLQPRVWIHLTENPRQGAAKLYASLNGPSNKTNPNWKPFEYLSLTEHQHILEGEVRKARAALFREILMSMDRLSINPEFDWPAKWQGLRYCIASQSVNEEKSGDGNDG